MNSSDPRWEGREAGHCLPGGTFWVSFRLPSHTCQPCMYVCTLLHLLHLFTLPLSSTLSSPLHPYLTLTPHSSHPHTPHPHTHLTHSSHLTLTLLTHSSHLTLSLTLTLHPHPHTPHTHSSHSLGHTPHFSLTIALPHTPHTH